MTMVEIPCDEPDNFYYHQSDGLPPLEDNMSEVNYQNSMVQQPLLYAFQHQQATVSSVTPESGQENGGNEALNTANVSNKGNSTLSSLENYASRFK